MSKWYVHNNIALGEQNKKTTSQQHMISFQKKKSQMKTSIYMQTGVSKQKYTNGCVAHKGQELNPSFRDGTGKIKITL